MPKVKRSVDDLRKKKARQEAEDALFLDALKMHGTFEMHVKGGSMMPTLLQGDVVVLSYIPPVARQGVSFGEVVSTMHDGVYRLHRVVGRRLGRHKLLTKGDALSAPDAWVAPNEVVARVLKACTKDGVSFQIGQRVATPLEKAKRVLLRWRRRS